MNVPELLMEVRRRVPPDAPVGARSKLASVVTLPERVHHVAAAARIDPHGRRREQFWCDDVRVEQPVLLRLTCSEGECPHATQVRAQWAAFQRRDRPGARAPTPPLPPGPLIAEQTITLAGQRYAARPARFPCFTPCPNGAHPPLTIDKSGYDLFDDSGCVGGGVTESNGVRRPRFPTLRAAEAYLLARLLEAQAVLVVASDATRDGPRPAGTGG